MSTLAMTAAWVCLVLQPHRKLLTSFVSEVWVLVWTQCILCKINFIHSVLWNWWFVKNCDAGILNTLGTYRTRCAACLFTHVSCAQLMAQSWVSRAFALRCARLAFQLVPSFLDLLLAVHGIIWSCVVPLPHWRKFLPYYHLTSFLSFFKASILPVK